MKRLRESRHAPRECYLLGLPEEMVKNEVARHLDFFSQWILRATCRLLRGLFPPIEGGNPTKYSRKVLKEAPLRFATLYWKHFLGDSNSQHAYYHWQYVPAYAQNPGHTRVTTLLDVIGPSKKSEPWYVLKGLLKARRDGLIREWQRRRPAHWNALSSTCQNQSNEEMCFEARDLYLIYLERDDYFEIARDNTLIPCITQGFMKGNMLLYFTRIVQSEIHATRCLRLTTDIPDCARVIDNNLTAITNDIIYSATRWGLFLLCTWHMERALVMVVDPVYLKSWVKNACRAVDVAWFRLMCTVVDPSVLVPDCRELTRYLWSRYEEIPSLDAMWDFFLAKAWLDFTGLSTWEKCHLVSDSQSPEREELTRLLRRDMARIPGGQKMLQVFDLFSSE